LSHSCPLGPQRIPEFCAGIAEAESEIEAINGERDRAVAELEAAEKRAAAQAEAFAQEVAAAEAELQGLSLQVKWHRDDATSRPPFASA
jgi:predicted  nucleic acid-binding Zn-ribbon protein